MHFWPCFGRFEGSAILTKTEMIVVIYLLLIYNKKYCWYLKYYYTREDSEMLIYIISYFLINYCQRNQCLINPWNIFACTKREKKLSHVNFFLNIPCYCSIRNVQLGIFVACTFAQIEIDVCSNIAWVINIKEGLDLSSMVIS